MKCLSDAQVSAFVEGLLDADELTDVDTHLDSCPTCRKLVASAGQLTDPSSMDLSPGARVGRYTVLQRVGAGSMGVVYSAYDASLDRRVALKSLLSASLEDDLGDGGQIQAEAQALAKLSHPNVVHVYEVFRHGDRTFLSMEYVEGSTLSEWIDQSDRSREDILRVLLDAGAGLSAAHQSGLVHRDIKPDNILIGADERPRVSDFGLARIAGTVSVEAAVPDLLQTQTLRTQTGLCAGTPAYMAPEQLEGSPATEKSDQFGFAVVAYEALTKTRPFPAKTLEQLRERLQQEPERPSMTGFSGHERAVLAALRRGLDPDPARRFGSLSDLLQALAPPKGKASRFGTAAVVVGLVAVAGAVWARSDGEAGCSGATALVQASWSETQKQSVRARFKQVRPSYGAAAADTVGRLLDRYAKAWEESRTAACLETQVRKEQSATLLDRRMQCHDDLLAELSALVGLFERADTKLVARAVNAASGLRPISRCSRAALLAEGALPSAPEERAATIALRELLVRVRTDKLAGHYKKAESELREALSGKDTALRHQATKAEALALLGDVEKKLGMRSKAERNLERAVFAGENGGNPTAAAMAAVSLIGVLRQDASRHKEAEHWARHAERALEAAGSPSQLQADFHLGLGNFALSKGKDPTKHYETALSVVRQERKPAGAQEALALHNLAIAHSIQGRLPKALKAHRQALQLRRRLLSADHPEVAESIHSIANVLNRQGRFSEAVDEYRRALGIARRSLGPTHPAIGDFLGNMATALLELGRYAEARKALQEARTILTRAFGKESSDLGYVYVTLGDVAVRQEHAREASDYYGRAIAIWTRKLASNHPELAAPLAGMAEAKLLLGERDAAIEFGQRALGLVEKESGRNRIRAQVRFVLARALYPRDPEQARALAKRSASDFQPGSPGRRKAEAWLQQHEN